MNTTRKRELATKWLTGTITDAEKAEFGRWFNEHDDEHFYTSAENEDVVKERIFQRVITVNQAAEGRRDHGRLKWGLGLAASFLICLSIWMHHSIYKPEFTAANKPKVPTLTFADGSSVTLSATEKGIISGNHITYLNGQTIDADGSGAAVQQLKLSTPKEMTYMVTLPDGSEVTLNAGSTLKYPSSFSADERVVELEGEAFFEVTKVYKDRKGSARVPFKVKTAGQVIEVLGTQFNVDAYIDGSITRTTLVEGSVKVTRGEAYHTATLIPGQQAIVDSKGLSVKTVDTQPFTAWKDGYFYFENTGVTALIAQLQRWYDLKVTYGETVPDQVFSGKIPRNISLKDACHILNKAGVNIRFTGDGHIHIASPNKTNN